MSGDAAGDRTGDRGDEAGREADEGQAGGAAGEEDTGVSPREVTRRPTVLSSALAVSTATFVAVLGGIYSGPALVLGLVGALSFAVAALRGSRTLADLGGLALLLSTVGAGLAAPEYVVLACAVGTVLAWDLSTNAIGMGEQVGRDPDTATAELVHAAGTLVVGAVTAGAAYAIYLTAAGGQPATAVVLLLLAALAIVSALRL